jgi:hypothetical protein
MNNVLSELSAPEQSRAKEILAARMRADDPSKATEVQ